MSAACWYERRCLLHIGPVPGFHVLGTLPASVWRTLAWWHGPAVPGHARKRTPAQEGKPHRMQQQAAGHCGAAGSASSRAPPQCDQRCTRLGTPSCATHSLCILVLVLYARLHVQPGGQYFTDGRIIVLFLPTMATWN